MHPGSFTCGADVGYHHSLGVASQAVLHRHPGRGANVHKRTRFSEVRQKSSTGDCLSSPACTRLPAPLHTNCCAGNTQQQ